ncbi:hypothetical protein EYF80_049895 [Liparis tanakae]|uniref:Uncharacterized protein n=1 Tax=Liparis tanakae TaxID=230148 RepID=A0A4Z2FFK4_9TELE|nr:hypothetical protein EYF80_049895 [Liparis tanakae]
MYAYIRTTSPRLDRQQKCWRSNRGEVVLVESSEAREDNRGRYVISSKDYPENNHDGISSALGTQKPAIAVEVSSAGGVRGGKIYAM